MLLALLRLSPEIKTRNHIFAVLVFVCVQNLQSLAFITYPKCSVLLTSLVLECNILTFFPVMTCISSLVSMCRISMKDGSNARM